MEEREEKGEARYQERVEESGGSDRPGRTSCFYNLRADVFGRMVNLSEPRFWHPPNGIITPVCTVH